MNKYIITKSGNNQYYFKLTAENGETILSSEGYLSHQSCLSGIQSVRINSQFDIRYHRKTAINGQPFFTLTSSNGQVIGVSEMYNTLLSRDNGINSVKRNAPNATIDDRSLNNAA